MSDELMTKVQALVDSTINPAVAGHGDFVQLLGRRLRIGGMEGVESAARSSRE